MKEQDKKTLKDIAKELDLEHSKKDRRVKCIYCGENIHIDKFAGMNKKGLFCNNIFCLIKLIEDNEKEKVKGDFQ